MRWTIATMFFVACLAVQPASAQEIDETLFFPVVARTAGVGGTQWVSDLTVHNLNDFAVTVGLQFFPANQANAFSPLFPDRLDLEARETMIVEDVLASIFGYTSDVKGALLVTTERDFIPSNPEDADFAAVTRTYNVGSPEGTFGQTVPATGSVIAATADPVYATGARNDDSFRTNLGIVSMAIFEEIRVHFRVLAEDGAVLTEGVRTMPQATLRQFSLDQLGVGTVDGAITVELWLDPDDVTPDPCGSDFPNMFIGYISKVDNGTGDAEFIFAAPRHEFDCPNR